MKKVGIFFSLILVAFVAQASGTSDTAEDAKKKSTKVDFDDLLVQGKYQFANESVTTVEDEKVLDSLLGVRKDFKDRIQQSSAKY